MADELIWEGTLTADSEIKKIYRPDRDGIVTIKGIWKGEEIDHDDGYVSPLLGDKYEFILNKKGVHRLYSDLYICACLIAEEKIFTGIYINHKYGEYKNTFYECGTEQVWRIKDNEIRNELDKIHQSSDLSKYGDLFIKIRGTLTIIDEQDKAHHDGIFTILELLDYSNDLKIIDRCGK